MIRPPPRSTLFPYPTLSRSAITLAPATFGTVLDSPVIMDSSTSADPSATVPSAGTRAPGRTRSEEHTSELQSRLHLVCRLLLEKNKTLIEQSRHCVRT